MGNTLYDFPYIITLPVHPHARGEHSARVSPIPCAGGSSPRPWGTRLPSYYLNPLDWFIPTPVGNTHRQSVTKVFHTVHPHARGEHIQEGEHIVTLNGSSPRPWGTLMTGTYGTDRRRFIPTPVGNTIWLRIIPDLDSVHPHARGEHPRQRQFLLTGVGSSPRPWGTQGNQLQVLKFGRFIPTPVGNTPPPTRPPGRQRFIPTPVGNTPLSITGFHHSSVHPHARGEHSTAEEDVFYGVGSSPRPWGTRQHDHPAGRAHRFIPTPVGNTNQERRSSDLRSVHPHARGEHGVDCFGAHIFSGSSPRPWGTQVIGR